jgi:hypothetical protein
MCEYDESLDELPNIHEVWAGMTAHWEVWDTSPLITLWCVGKGRWPVWWNYVVLPQAPKSATQGSM